MIAYQDHLVQLLQGDVTTMLKTLPDNYVQTVVTSPPYFNLRDYGVRGQIGLEKTPALYIRTMVKVFRQVRRVLKKNGTLWVNIGDCYNAGTAKNRNASTLQGSHGYWTDPHIKMRVKVKGLKTKDLIGIPWMFAFALRADGWYLRQEIIREKENASPESAKDRPTTSHDHIFLFSKSRRYYYDWEAIAEPVSENTHDRLSRKNLALEDGGPKAQGGAIIPGRRQDKDRNPADINRALLTKYQTKTREMGTKDHGDWQAAHSGRVLMRNKRSVWTVNSEASPILHYATFPEKLVEPCILAGAPVGGTAMDIFAGTSTTLLVAKKHGRKAIGIELSPEYCAMSADRLRMQLL